ncbi:hypothetical protein nbrc107696_12230 [Gordonia spumicola]|uniref:Amine oxidase domain-containing protein n=1 Tax=Gordonia spumicola TaxID=589161 RepID=A0A7I9V690_9ACTN|nr:NAD(P)/FAD-dependent oxidoreductase [Gordonia spumicola]GEE00777.1 hypothetical protein nbrc107696_12230 [Gordonia spumicola]
MNENDSDHIQARVAVVGGGLAGCTAALRLVEQGFSDVVVLEAADSPGGRVGTMSIVGQNLDSGAQFIGPEQTELLAIAAQLGLSEVPMYTDGQDIVRHVPGSNHPELEYFVTAIDEVAASLDLAAPWAHPDAVHLETSSVDAWAHTLGVTDRDALAYIASIVESFVGAQSGDVSVLWFATFVAGAGGWEQATKETLSSRIDGGAGQIIDRLAERLGDRVLVNSPVTAVVQGESSVTLTAGGVRVTADRVVLACSPNELCRMTFTPQLPAQRNELNSNWSFGGGVKFAVAYERPFWRDSELSGTIMPGPTTPVSRIWDNSPTDGSPVGILVGLASRRHVQSMLPPDRGSPAHPHRGVHRDLPRDRRASPDRVRREHLGRQTVDLGLHHGESTGHDAHLLADDPGTDRPTPFRRNGNVGAFHRIHGGSSPIRVARGTGGRRIAETQPHRLIETIHV